MFTEHLLCTGSQRRKEEPRGNPGGDWLGNDPDPLCNREVRRDRVGTGNLRAARKTQGEEPASVEGTGDTRDPGAYPVGFCVASVHRYIWKPEDNLDVILHALSTCFLNRVSHWAGAF